jgi:hypothetical protein
VARRGGYRRAPAPNGCTRCRPTLSYCHLVLVNETTELLPCRKSLCSRLSLGVEVFEEVGRVARLPNCLPRTRAGARGLCPRSGAIRRSGASSSRSPCARACWFASASAVSAETSGKSKLTSRISAVNLIPRLRGSKIHHLLCRIDVAESGYSYVSSFSQEDDEDGSRRLVARKCAGRDLNSGCDHGKVT